jgi:integrase
MPITIYRRGKVWHYRGTVSRRQLRGSTRTTDKERAQRIAAEVEARAWKRHLDGPGAVLTFAQAATLYLQAGKQPRFVRRILGYWKETPVAEITPGAIRQSAVTLYPDATGATRNRQVIVPTQAIINHAAESELCQRIMVKRFPVETKVRRPATWAWVQAFMSASSPHLGAVACFMYLTGARITEACSLTWADVELGHARALVRQTKIGAERWAHLPPVLVTAIANIPGPREGKVFRYSSRDTAKPPWRNACKRAGIEPLSFHSCRHGFATGLLDMGVSPITVAKRGGWKDARHVFETYGHDVASVTVTDLLISTKSAQSEPDDAQKVKKNKAVS